MEPANGPGHVFGDWVTRDAEARQVGRWWSRLMPRSRGAPRDIQEPTMIEPDRFQQAIDAAQPKPRRVRECGAEMRRSDRGHTENSPMPLAIAQQLTSVQPAHAVADDVDRLVGEGPR